MKNYFKTLSKIITLLLTLSGCAAEPIADHTVFGDLGNKGAVQEHTLFTDIAPVLITPDAWNVQRPGMVCMAVSDLSQIQQTVDDLCAKYTDACNYAAESASAALKTTITDIKLKMNEVGIIPN